MANVLPDRTSPFRNILLPINTAGNHWLKPHQLPQTITVYLNNAPNATYRDRWFYNNKQEITITAASAQHPESAPRNDIIIDHWPLNSVYHTLWPARLKTRTPVMPCLCDIWHAMPIWYRDFKCFFNEGQMQKISEGPGSMLQVQVRSQTCVSPGKMVLEISRGTRSESSLHTLIENVCAEKY